MRTMGMVLAIFAGSLIFGIGEVCSDQEAGIVLTVKRDVFLIRDGRKVEADARSPLFLKDAVETDKRSRTKLFFTDDSILNMGELSHLVVEEYLYAEGKAREKSVYRLIEGSLKVVVGKSALEIHTPTAVAAARGTKFIMWVEGTGELASTGLIVLEGEVLVRSMQNAVQEMKSIQGGQMSRIPRGGSPEPAQPTAPGVLGQYGGRTLAIGSVFRDKKGEAPLPPRPGGGPRPGPGGKQIRFIKQPPIRQQPPEGNLRLRIDWDPSGG